MNIQTIDINNLSSLNYYIVYLFNNYKRKSNIRKIYIHYKFPHTKIKFVCGIEYSINKISKLEFNVRKK